MGTKNIKFVSLIVGFMLIANGKASISKEVDLFNEIVNKAGGQVIEYGVRASFVTKSIEEENMKDLLEKMGYYNSIKSSLTDHEKVVTLDFKRDNTYGFMEAAKLEDNTYITIDIKERSTVNNINLLRKNIEDAVNKTYTNVKYYLYFKAEITENNLLSINNGIRDILKSNGAKNIETVEINNGFSGVAYTGKYESIKSNGKLIDLNYAVASYDSGNFIIIGTPVIKELY